MIEGFYKDKKGNFKTKANSCARCGLYQSAQSYKIQPYGNFRQKIMVIGEAPGRQEDTAGLPWQGTVGKLLQRTLKRFGIDLFEDCVSINAVNCRPPGNKKPTSKQITCCREMVVKDVLKQYNPDLILLLGNSAIESFLGHRWKKDLRGVNRWRGWTIPDQDHRAWVCPTYHPSFVVRSEEQVKNIWMKDLRRALEKLNDRFPEFVKPEIETIDDLSRLKEINADLTSMDYETTGKKPQRQGHRIVACSIADREDHAFSFMMPQDKKQLQYFLDYLGNAGIGKVIANASFEKKWTNVTLKHPINGIVFDTMLAAHILDNRSYITGLKFQVYVNFGIVDYTEGVDEYIYTGETGNDFNKIHELISTEEGRHKLLKFVGWDSVLELRLGKMQARQLNYDYLPTL